MNNRQKELSQAFIAGVRWARMAAQKAFDEDLIEKDAYHYAITKESDGDGEIICRGDGTLRHVLANLKATSS